MALNPHFNNFGFTATQNLTEDLIIESIKIYGVETYYLPRTLVNEDVIMGSDDLSKFESAIPIEMYVKNVEGYEGQGEFLSRFGLQIQDNVTFTVSKKRFEQEASTLDPLRPKEGDLLWFPMAQDLFEIKFVEHEEVFYQMGKLMTYSISCERFIYSDEDLNTGVEEIDDLEITNSTNIPILMVAGGTGDFTVGETVTGSIGSNIAEVASWDPTTRYLRIFNFDGEFINGEIVTGDTSGAIHTIEEVNYQKLNTDENDEDNFDIQLGSDDIFDFSENDPFSEGFY